VKYINISCVCGHG